MVWRQSELAPWVLVVVVEQVGREIQRASVELWEGLPVNHLEVMFSWVSQVRMGALVRVDEVLILLMPTRAVLGQEYWC